MKISRIAVGVDFSPASEHAAHAALVIARRHGAEVVLVHVAAVPDPLEREASELVGARKYREILLERLHDEREQLGALRERLSGQGVEVSTSIIDSSFPDQSLVTAAKELHADLLLVGGTAGRTGLDRVLLGSTAEGVVRRSTVPTMVVRDGEGPDHYRRILVPSDSTPASARALELAMAIGDSDAHIDVLDMGEPRAMIRDRASQYDLICMGSHDARYTVRHAPCSVATVHD